MSNYTSYLRFDSVSTMLVYSSFLNDANTLIYEDTDNIVTMAYASRTSSAGRVVALNQTGQTKTKNMSIFNLSQEQKDVVKFMDVKSFIGTENEQNQANIETFENFFSKYFI
jgi:hypothetical protein